MRLAIDPLFFPQTFRRRNLNNQTDCSTSLCPLICHSCRTQRWKQIDAVLRVRLQPITRRNTTTLLVDYAESDSCAGGMHPVRCIKLASCIGQIVIDRVLGKTEDRGDFIAGLSKRDPMYAIYFAPSQRFAGIDFIH